MQDQDRLQTIEIVWQTINDSYFDPTFGRLDWNEIHERYRPLIVAAKSDADYYRRVNEMPFELGMSGLEAVTG